MPRQTVADETPLTPDVPFVYDPLDGEGDRLETGPHGLHQKDTVRFGERNWEEEMMPAK